MIDRLAPTRRPRALVIGRQRWRDLLFLHWPVGIDTLRRRVPAQLTIDTFEGTAYVGVVAFVMESLALAGVLKALSLSFLETNVRTYVHVEGGDPGVYFFSLDANSPFAVIAARASFGLPYYAARMRLSRVDPLIAYTTQRERPIDRRAFLTTRYEPGEVLGPAKVGTLDHFLLERYILHVLRFRRVWSAHIHHEPYLRQVVQLETIDEDLIAAAGLIRPSGPPPIVHYARGVDVELFAPHAR